MLVIHIRDGVYGLIYTACVHTIMTTRRLCARTVYIYTIVLYNT